MNGVLPPAATAINLLSNSEVAERDDKLRLATAAVQNQESVASALAAHVRSCFEQAESYRRVNGITERLLDAQRRRRGVYSATKLAEIEALGGSKLHTHDTEVKCNAAEALIEDVLAPMGEKIWSIEATPMPDIPDDIKTNIIEATMMKLAMEIQDGSEMPDENAIREYAQNLREEIEDELKAIAKERADRMSLLMDDQIVEMKFRDVFSEFLSNLVTYGTGFIEGPIVIRRKDMAWEGSDYAVSERHVLAAEAPSPFDMYPQPDKVKMDDGWIIRRRRMSGKDLSLAKKLSGYIEREIIDLLTTRPAGHREYLPEDQERSDNELKGSNLQNEGRYYDVLDFWGSIAGAMLEEFGMKGLVPTDFYDVRVMTCANRVIRVMPNPDPLGRHPYYAAQYKKVVGSLWGSGVPHLIAPSQDLANAAIRAIANNMGIASGPMVAIDVSRLPPGTNIETLHPWQLFQFRNPNGIASDPIKFFQPDSNVQALMLVYDRALQKMDDESGIPAYSYGNEDVAGAGRALANYEKVLTPTGPVAIGNMKAGDVVSNTYGGQSSVLAVYPQGETDVFRVAFSNGEHVDCDMNHQWAVRSHHGRKFQVMTLAAILSKGLFRKTKIDQRNPKGYRPRWMLPRVELVEFSEKPVKIDPYTMGALLGDGDARCRLTGMDEEIFARIPYHLGAIDFKDEANKAISRTVKGIKDEYRGYGLLCKSTEKFIPEDYLYNTKAIRLELLRGLMDTDGCCSKEGDKTFFATSSPRLAHDFAQLVRSLGAASTSIEEHEGVECEIKGWTGTNKTHYRVNFYLHGETIFHLKRKQSRVRPKQSASVYITGVEYIGKGLATCITVDSRDHLFVCQNCIPTHNTMGGLSMLLNASAKSIKEAMVRIDQDILAKFMERLYVWNMVYSPDADIKGDAKVSTYGASRNIMHDMKLARLMDFADRHANPIDMQVLGLGGRAEIMRIEAELIDKRLVRLIPTVDAMQQIQAKMAEAGADPAMMAEESGGRNTAGTPSKTARMLPAG